MLPSGKIFFVGWMRCAGPTNDALGPFPTRYRALNE
jgi:hypothetical protein